MFKMLQSMLNIDKINSCTDEKSFWKMKKRKRKEFDGKQLKISICCFLFGARS